MFKPLSGASVSGAYSEQLQRQYVSTVAVCVGVACGDSQATVSYLLLNSFHVGTFGYGVADMAVATTLASTMVQGRRVAA